MRRSAFPSHSLARLFLCIMLLAQASMASAAPADPPNEATSGSAKAPAASCAPNLCTSYIPWIVAGVPPTTPEQPPTTPEQPPTTPEQPPTTPEQPPTTPAADAEPPTAPANLRAAGKSDISISLAWDAASDNVAVTQYELYRGSTLVRTATGLSAIISALTASTTYTFTVIARDAAGNVSAASAPLIATTDPATPSGGDPTALDTRAPSAPANLRVASKTHGTIGLTWDASNDDVAVAEYDLYDGGVWIGWTEETSFTITNLPAASSHSFHVEAYDTSANASEPSQALSITTDLPPDPSAVASPVDQTVASDIAGDTAFLYTGIDPIQNGVAPGTIEPQRVAILRGRVTDRNGAPIAGVQIRVLDHPEYGGTASRSDGAFDLAVNGGGPLTIDYQKDGYLPAQRQAVTAWRDYAVLPDVTLVALDQAVTAISLDETSPLQVAAGSVVSDGDGMRQALLIFPAGVSAVLELPDGEEQTLTTLHVRATEYTVGDRGPQAMPATLPPNSGYTYAVEYSVDEALAAGARAVHFSRPVVGYVENFLGLRLRGASLHSVA
jgi:chitodextrinase